MVLIDKYVKATHQGKQIIGIVMEIDLYGIAAILCKNEGINEHLFDFTEPYYNTKYVGIPTEQLKLLVQ